MAVEEMWPSSAAFGATQKKKKKMIKGRPTLDFLTGSEGEVCYSTTPTEVLIQKLKAVAYFNNKSKISFNEKSCNRLLNTQVFFLSVDVTQWKYYSMQQLGSAGKLPL